jgi:hypothetical protein
MFGCCNLLEVDKLHGNDHTEIHLVATQSCPVLYNVSGTVRLTHQHMLHHHLWLQVQALVPLSVHGLRLHITKQRHQG